MQQLRPENQRKKKNRKLMVNLRQRERRWNVPKQVDAWSYEQFTRLLSAVAQHAVPAGCRGGVSDGIPNRVDRLRGLGNAVVPQVAEWIGRMIVESAKGN